MLLPVPEQWFPSHACHSLHCFHFVFALERTKFSMKDNMFFSSTVGFAPKVKGLSHRDNTGVPVLKGYLLCPAPLMTVVISVVSTRIDE